MNQATSLNLAHVSRQVVPRLADADPNREILACHRLDR